MNTTLRSRLTQQLGFLDLSCQAYDAGYRDEAIRIAGVLRILFHTTSKSTSVLDQLGQTAIELLSTCSIGPRPEPPPGMKQARLLFGLAPIEFGPQGIAYVPPLGSAHKKRFVPLGEWWTEVVFCLIPDTDVTRRDVVLGAANKEGGAHVDPTLTRKYQALISQTLWRYSRRAGNYLEEGELAGSRFAALRQMGYEVLNSPAVIALGE